MSELSETIFAANDVELVPEHVPEWGVTLYIKSLSPVEIEEADLLDNAAQKRGEIFSMATLIKGVCNEQGQPVFTTEDIPKLRGKRLQVLLRLMQRVRDLNNVEIEELEKNSEPTT